MEKFPLTYRKKTYLLCLAAAVFILVAFRVAVTPTLRAYREQSVLQGRLDSAASAPMRPAAMRKELRQLERYLATYRADSAHADPLLWGLTPVCRRLGVRIESLPPAEEEEKGSYSILTRTVRLQGGFIPLLKAVYAMEHDLKAGRVAAVQFVLQEEPLQGRPVLQAECHIQQIKEKP